MLFNKQQLSKKIIKHLLKDIFAKYPVEFAYLFGSYATNEAGQLSDIDIAVYLDQNLREQEQEQTIGALRSDIEKALQMPDKIGLICLNQELAPFLERNIVYDGELIYEKNDTARVYYESGAICRWLDYQPHHNRFMKENLHS